MLSSLPFNIIDQIILVSQQRDLVALAATNKMFHHKVNQQLYNHIVISDSETSNVNYTIVPVSKLKEFARSLNVFTFQFIQKLEIHSQSNLIQYNYLPLYNKISSLWDSRDRTMHFVNLDIPNLKTSFSFNQFIMNNTVTYMEEEDDFSSVSGNNKVNNLNNWIVFDYNELRDLPYNPNLTDLDIHIQHLTASLDMKSLGNNMLRNLKNLKGLYLTTSRATSKFMELSNVDLRMDNLRKLCITFLHSHTNQPLMFHSLNKMINLNELEELELDVDCANVGCSCIYNFFYQWLFENCIHDNMINLKKLFLINHKGNSSKQNLAQFESLINSKLLTKLSKLEYLYLNINDYLKVGHNQFNIKELSSTLRELPNLTTFVLPDFFYNWRSTLPLVFNETSKTSYDLLLNECSCSDCECTRSKFKQNAHAHTNCSRLDDEIHPTRISLTKSNLQYFNYIISLMKKQLPYINKDIYSINSSINSSIHANTNSLVKNRDIDDFCNLFMHNSLNDFAGFIKNNNPKMKSINLGGILMEYDNSNEINLPLNNN